MKQKGLQNDSREEYEYKGDATEGGMRAAISWIRIAWLNEKVNGTGIDAYDKIHRGRMTRAERGLTRWWRTDAREGATIPGKRSRFEERSGKL